ncbi:MAG: hypothetical protein LH660_03615 [Phormidesmis sp. CAN_BIN36]|nr:hypothetical protein [Phormidesmis sp. CAN_BIN36]
MSICAQQRDLFAKKVYVVRAHSGFGRDQKRDRKGDEPAMILSHLRKQPIQKLEPVGG